MNVEYTKRSVVYVRESTGEPGMDVDCEVTGIVTFDRATDHLDWFHNSAKFTIKMKMYDGQYKRIDGRAAEAVYDSFCKQHPAWELAQQEAA